MVESTGIRKHYLDVVNALYRGHGRPFIGKVVELLDRTWGKRNVFLIGAPTGYGKTAISLTVAKYSIEEELKAVIAYPLRALLEQQVLKFKELFSKCGTGGKVVGVRYMMNPESPYFVRPVTLTTVDTLALTTLGVAPEDLGKVLSSLTGNGREWGSMGHYVFAWASAFTSNIVVDEAHLLADSGRALAFISFLAREAVLHDQHLIIMTATMPSHLLKAVREAVGRDGSEKVMELKFTDYLGGLQAGGVGDDFIADRVGKEYVVETMPVTTDGCGSKEVVDWLREACESSVIKSPRILAVFNTVKEAVEAYRLAIKELPIKPERILLLHSRFTAADREALARRLEELAEGVKEGRDREPYAIIATQAVEAGVDLTSNIFATDAAPPTTLIQRAGRFLRYGERLGKALLWWDSSGSDGELKVSKLGTYKVYDARLVKVMINWVRNRGGRVNLHLPETPKWSRALIPKPGYGEVLEKAYVELRLPPPRKLLAEMEDIVTDYMRGSKRAGKLLYELGGSFIRDSALIPAIPEELTRHAKDFKELMKYVVPLTPLTLLRLNNARKVVGVITDSEHATSLPRHIRDALDRALKYWFRSPVNALREVIKVTVCLGISAFVVRAEYDSMEGLKA